MTDRICNVPDCGRESLARQMCRRHYNVWYEADRRGRISAGIPSSLAERYNARVAVAGPDDCWLWTGYRDHWGYGRIYSATIQTKVATRIGWQLTYGKPVPDDLHVCHHCDNPPCCNPAHWYLGTHLENQADKGRKGRSGGIKLTTADVSAIRAALTGRHGEQVELAARYGVSFSLISQIKRGHRSEVTTANGYPGGTGS